MQLFGDVRLERIDAQGRWREAGEGQQVVCRHEIGFAEDRFAQDHVRAEALSVDLTGELAFHTEAHPIVLQAIVQQFGMLCIRHHLESHEVTQIEPPCGL